MSQNRDIVAHMLRTTVLVIVLAAVGVGLFLVMLYLRLHPYLIFATLGVGVVGVVYGTARWHPYWAPIAKRVARIPWRRDDGAAMETLVERAIVQSGMSIRTETYRISIYQCEGRRRVARRVLGDEVDFLGVFDSGIWFHIRDRFYARRDGLVCIDKQSGQWAYHQPKSVVEAIESVDRMPGIFDAIWNHGATRLDLRTNPPKILAQ